MNFLGEGIKNLPKQIKYLVLGLNGNNLGRNSKGIEFLGKCMN